MNERVQKFESLEQTESTKEQSTIPVSDKTKPNVVQELFDTLKQQEQQIEELKRRLQRLQTQLDILSDRIHD